MNQNEALKIIIETRIGVVQKLVNAFYDTLAEANNKVSHIDDTLSLLKTYQSEKQVLEDILRTYESQNKKVS